jgi:hypothetical protein
VAGAAPWRFKDVCIISSGALSSTSWLDPAALFNESRDFPMLRLRDMHGAYAAQVCKLGPKGAKFAKQYRYTGANSPYTLAYTYTCRDS